MHAAGLAVTQPVYHQSLDIETLFLHQEACRHIQTKHYWSVRITQSLNSVSNRAARDLVEVSEQAATA